MAADTHPGAAHMFRVGFCVSGQGRIFREAVESADAQGVEIALLVAEQQAGEELDGFCHSHGITMVRLPAAPRETFDRVLSATLCGANLDLVVLTFDKLVPPSVVAMYEGRILNLHIGLLPGSEGLHPLRRTLASNARFGGATLHEVTNGTDSGPIVAQCVAGVLPDDTSESLGARIYPLARDLVVRAIGWYAGGRVRRDGGRVLIDGARYGEIPSAPVS